MNEGMNERMNEQTNRWTIYDQLVKSRRERTACTRPQAKCKHTAGFIKGETPSPHPHPLAWRHLLTFVVTTPALLVLQNDQYSNPDLNSSVGVQ